MYQSFKGLRSLSSLLRTVEGCPYLICLKILRSTVTTTLDLSNCSYITDTAIIRLGECCPQLSDLNLSDCNTTDTAIIGIVEGCPQLNSLNLSHCNITDTWIRIAEGCPNFLSFNLKSDGKENIIDASIMRFTEDYIQLNTLNFVAISLTQLSSGY